MVNLTVIQVVRGERARKSRGHRWLQQHRFGPDGTSIIGLRRAGHGSREAMRAYIRSVIVGIVTESKGQGTKIKRSDVRNEVAKNAQPESPNTEKKSGSDVTGLREKRKNDDGTLRVTRGGYHASHSIPASSSKQVPAVRISFGHSLDEPASDDVLAGDAQPESANRLSLNGTRERNSSHAATAPSQENDLPITVQVRTRHFSVIWILNTKRIHRESKLGPCRIIEIGLRLRFV